MNEELQRYIENYKNITARVHSMDSFGAVDGPGVRFVLFLQGCKLRCLYCHNPDTWELQGDKEMNLREILKKIVANKKLYKKGGVTIIGGEPMLQHEFLFEFLRALKNLGFHTAVDTNGFVELEFSKKCIDEAAMLLLDIKEVDEADCISLTAQSNHNALQTLKYCQSINKPLWIRYVCVPGYTLQMPKIHALAKLLAPYTCVQKVQLLPFHQLGAYKYKELKIPYKLAQIKPPSEELMSKANEILQGYGLRI